MDENMKLLLKSMQGLDVPPGDEPVSYDVTSLLAESRNRVYTVEGRKLVDATKPETDAVRKPAS
jgi:hypothetical protein